jgi:hypothetical protein
VNEAAMETAQEFASWLQKAGSRKRSPDLEDGLQPSFTISANYDTL